MLKECCFSKRSLLGQGKRILALTSAWPCGFWFQGWSLFFFDRRQRSGVEKGDFHSKYLWPTLKPTPQGYAHVKPKLNYLWPTEPRFKNGKFKRVSPSHETHSDSYMHHFFNVATPVLFYNFYFAWPCRHEPPVLAGAVIILEDSPDVITVCKPASVPVRVIEEC